MAKYDALIRFRKWELDEERRKLTSLQDERDGILAEMQSMLDTLKENQSNVDPSIAVFAMGQFLEGMRVRQYELEADLENKNKEVDEQQDVVAGKFQDLKTIEIAAEKLARQEAEKQAAADQMALDEASLQLFQRTKEEKA